MPEVGPYRNHKQLVAPWTLGAVECWNRPVDRDQRIRRIVLDCICDDYENVDQTILRDVRDLGARIGWTIDRSEVVKALAGLVADGLAIAHNLSAMQPNVTELDGMPPLDATEHDFKTYFLATRKGIDLQTSDDSWWLPEFEPGPD